MLVSRKETRFEMNTRIRFIYEKVCSCEEFNRKDQKFFKYYAH